MLPNDIDPVVVAEARGESNSDGVSNGVGRASMSKRVSRRFAFHLLSHLFSLSTAAYMRDERYNLHFQQQLLRIVETHKQERAVMIVAMARERGDMRTSVDYVKSVLLHTHAGEEVMNTYMQQLIIADVYLCRM